MKERRVKGLGGWEGGKQGLEEGRNKGGEKMEDWERGEGLKERMRTGGTRTEEKKE